jgi:hypothetical protein
MTSLYPRKELLFPNLWTLLASELLASSSEDAPHPRPPPRIMVFPPAVSFETPPKATTGLLSCITYFNAKLRGIITLPVHSTKKNYRQALGEIINQQLVIRHQ